MNVSCGAINCDAPSRVELWGLDFPSRVELWGCDAPKKRTVKGKHTFIKPCVRDFHCLGVLTFCWLSQSFPWKDLMVLQGVLGADAARQVRFMSNLCEIWMLANWSGLHNAEIQGSTACVMEKCSPLNRLLYKTAQHIIVASRSCVLPFAQFWLCSIYTEKEHLLRWVLHFRVYVSSFHISSIFLVVKSCSTFRTKLLLYIMRRLDAV